MGNTMGNGTSLEGAKFEGIPSPLMEEVKQSVHKHSHVNIWWPKDKKCYAGKILDIESQHSEDGGISTSVTVLYNDGEVQQYPMNLAFYRRVGIGKVIPTCFGAKFQYLLLLISFGMILQLLLEPEYARKVMSEEITLENAQVEAPKH